MAGYVEIDRATLTYGGGSGVTALRGASLSVGKGECVAVVGPSGCGKSSLLKIVTGLVRLTEGTVAIDGKKVSGPVKIVGMAFQNPILLRWRTTLENVMLPLEIVQPHRQNLRRDFDRYAAIARELLATVGLAGFENSHPWELSGGMQQRASLCRALIHQPSLLMLDEPFASLDAFTREELCGVLQKLWLQRAFTLVLVTHDLREAVFMADTVHVMSSRPGRVILSRKVPFPRPRTLEDTFRPEFVEIVHELRRHIGQELRGQTGEASAA